MNTQLLSHQTGFTILEIMTVLAILSILIAMAGPGLLNMMPMIRLNNATQGIVNDLQFARMRSITTSKEYRLNFDPSTESYRIEEGDRSEGSSWPGSLVDLERRLNDQSSMFYQKDIDIESVTQNPVFTPKGLCSTNSTIKIKNSAGGKKKITVNLAGGIKVYDSWD
ncbi:MAG: prepilin-type N-terminal cleavage/methylation domain-containing protein [bacterium]|nr:prepilin-type N-terminal cleavage/methylation domain-containing protein [bacterium]